MANSNRKRIIDNVVSTIAAITTGGGYNFSIGQCQRGFKHYNAVPEDLFPSVYAAGADEDRKNSAQRTFTSSLMISVVGYVKTTDAANTAALEQDIDNLIEDITKALMVDVTRGGYAVTTELGEINTDKGAFTPYASVEIIVHCEYRAAVTAP